MATGDDRRARLPLAALLIDNFDSFANNIADLIGSITAVPVRVVPNTITWDEFADAARHADFVVIGPGPGSPDKPGDFGVCCDVLRDCHLPVLGVCLGMQGMAHHLAGARIVQCQPGDARHGTPRLVHHDGTHDLFQGVPTAFKAVRYNSLLVEANARCRVLAWCLDPYAPMAIDLGGGGGDGPRSSLVRIGVQFHPESHLTQYGRDVVHNFMRHFVVPRRPEPICRPSAPDASSRARTATTPVSIRHRCVPGVFGGPGAVFAALRRRDEWAAWLDSDTSTSYLCVGAGDLSHTLRYDVTSRMVTRCRQGASVRFPVPSFFDCVDDELAGLALDDASRSLAAGLPFDFLGGYCGWFGYEMKAECGHTNTCLPARTPDAAFLFVDRLIVIDDARHETHLIALTTSSSTSSDADSWLETCLSTLRRLCTVERPPAPVWCGSSEFTCRDTLPSYRDKVRHCLEAIAQGESYELCLTTAHEARLSTDDVDPLAVHLNLRQSNPAPHARYFEFGPVAVCCSSPERFLRVDRHRQVSSEPMKGTRKRGASPGRDRTLRQSLASSEKDLAENLMITDLVRHDLSSSCVPGSVVVDQFCDLRTYPNVHQLVSVIRGRLPVPCTPVQCIRRAFPPGSMTGAPKRRAMQILEGLEGSPRGIYSGVSGFLSVSGTADFNVVIRTVVLDRATSAATVGAGGAVVSQSVPDDEFAEMQLKARAPIRALRPVARKPAADDDPCAVPLADPCCQSA
ncbi:aminodeoxychorismate synthase [Plasmodiophora brassicae]